MVITLPIHMVAFVTKIDKTLYCIFAAVQSVLMLQQGKTKFRQTKMGLFKSRQLFHITIIFLIFAFLTENVDGRRKILRGRKTVTRTYHQDPALPAWAIILLVGIVELLVGGIFYIILKKKIIDPPLVGAYAPANININ